MDINSFFLCLNFRLLAGEESKKLLSEAETSALTAYLQSVFAPGA